jgi:hypothetical protein
LGSIKFFHSKNGGNHGKNEATILNSLFNDHEKGFIRKNFVDQTTHALKHLTGFYNNEPVYGSSIPLYTDLVHRYLEETDTNEVKNYTSLSRVSCYEPLKLSNEFTLAIKACSVHNEGHRAFRSALVTAKIQYDYLLLSSHYWNARMEEHVFSTLYRFYKAKQHSTNNSKVFNRMLSPRVRSGETAQVSIPHGHLHNATFKNRASLQLCALTPDMARDTPPCLTHYKKENVDDKEFCFPTVTYPGTITRIEKLVEDGGIWIGTWVLNTYKRESDDDSRGLDNKYVLIPKGQFDKTGETLQRVQMIQSAVRNQLGKLYLPGDSQPLRNSRAPDELQRLYCQLNRNAPNACPRKCPKNKFVCLLPDETCDLVNKTRELNFYQGSVNTDEWKTESHIFSDADIYHHIISRGIQKCDIQEPVITLDDDETDDDEITTQPNPPNTRFAALVNSYSDDSDSEDSDSEANELKAQSPTQATNTKYLTRSKVKAKMKNSHR